jgi:hypothetical protein
VILASAEGDADQSSPDITQVVGSTTFQIWYSDQEDAATVQFDHDIIVNGNDLPADDYTLQLSEQDDETVRVVFEQESRELTLELAVRSTESDEAERLRLGFVDVVDGVEPAAINDKLPPDPSSAKVVIEWSGHEVYLHVVMTGQRRRSAPAPDIPEHLAEPWSIVEASLDGFVNEDVEKHIEHFTSDFTSGLVFGEGLDAHVRFVDSSKIRGVFEDVLLELDRLKWHVEEDSVVFEGIGVYATSYWLPFTYELERREGEWTVTRLGLE